MKKDKVQIVCILDMSGSMRDLATEVINSFNHFISEQKKLKGKAEVTLVLFDHVIEKPYYKVKLKDVKDIDETLYKPRGMTALYDAIGLTVEEFSEHKDVVLLIQTDGEENSSKEYTQSIIKDMIKDKEQDGWDITFLGANIDAKAVGSSLGVSLLKSVQYSNSADGIHEAFACMSKMSSDYRAKKLGD